MPLFEDPALLSKSRLRSDLVAHNVTLPPVKSKKEVYVELHLKNIDQKKAADFSSDEEDQAQNEADKEEDREDAEIPDPSCLTDDDLKAALLKHGVKAGPIVASTRALYEKKLRKLLQSAGHDHLNGAEKGVLYSDSEEEEKEEEEEEGSEGAKEETVEEAEQAQQESSQLPPEPVKATMKDIFPDSRGTPTGISATCRRPIKGAARRPIQYSYPDTPASPTTLERREVERRLVPIRIQILVFLILVVFLYFVNVCIEDNSFSPFVALLDSLNQGSDSEEGLSLQSETQDTPALSGQE